MKSKAKQAEECATLFEIEVKPETVAKAFEEVYAEITRISNIPGFRTGKAPLELVKKHYAKDARDEVLKRLIPEGYSRALKTHGVSPAGMPDITDVNFEEEARRLSFKARVDTHPVFKIKDYKGIKVEKKRVDIRDEDIEKTLQNLREMNAAYIVVEDRAAQMGDYVVSDLNCVVDGKPAHKKRENLWLFLEKESLVPGLCDQMIGMKKGDEKDIEVTLPDKYPDKNLAGKRALYHVAAKEIRLRKLPDVDDSFAKDLGKENLEELKKEIRRELEARAKISAEVDIENQILKTLADENVFGVPSSFVNRQLAFMVEDAKSRLQQKGFKPEDLDKKDAEFSGKFKDDAARQVRLLFILDEIARTENIEVEEKDEDVAYKSIAIQAGKDEAAVKAHYEKEDLVDNLRQKLREGKVIQFLLKNAVIAEK